MKKGQGCGSDDYKCNSSSSMSRRVELPTTWTHARLFCELHFVLEFKTRQASTQLVSPLDDVKENGYGWEHMEKSQNFWEFCVHFDFF